MNQDFDSLLQTHFLPVAEIKAKLSEKIRETKRGKRIAITSNGRPEALLLSYEDYLDLLRRLSATETPSKRVIDFKQWKKDSKKRRKISQSILRHFNPDLLPRKGQKNYKREKVRATQRKPKK